MEKYFERMGIGGNLTFGGRTNFVVLEYIYYEAS